MGAALYTDKKFTPFLISYMIDNIFQCFGNLPYIIFNNARRQTVYTICLLLRKEEKLDVFTHTGPYKNIGR